MDETTGVAGVEEVGVKPEDFLADAEASDTETTQTEELQQDMEEDAENKTAISKKRVVESPADGSGQGKKAKVETEKKTTEDVCFVCHDGGELVCCDKRECPKVYHSACIGVNVVEAESTWYCGWHYCAECNKAGASYHCVTCIRSYCPKHYRTSEFTVLKAKLGLCYECMPQVRVIENGVVNEIGDSENGLEELLFKDYWLDQRSKLGLILPKDGTARSTRASTQTPTKETAEDDEDSVATEEVAGDDEPGAPTPPPVERRKFDSWASPELLAFLTARGSDVTKALRRDDVEKAVWEYIKEKGLQSPEKPAEIRCDEALEKLLRRKTVGRLAMIRILQEHFSGSPTQRGASGRRMQMGAKGAIAAKEKKVTLAGTKRLNRSESSKKRKAAAISEPEAASPPAEYAAISRKNIELLYLRRNLLEALVGHADFEGVVKGGFVRIKTQAIDDPSKAAYRLVPVLGVVEGPEYAIGRKTTTLLLKVQNLSKVEDTRMDQLSSQDFDEDELTRLWRATKVAEVFEPMTIGQVEAKAREILPTKVDEAMEAEKQKLVNLRDRASELGEMKELKRIVEQLKELERPETRAARVNGPLGIEADPKMDPAVPYDPDAEEKEKQEKEAKQRAAAPQKSTPASITSPRERKPERTSRWAPRGTDTDRRRPQETPPENRRPVERQRERSRERERGRRSPYSGTGARDREIVSPRGEDRRKDSGPDRRSGDRFTDRPRASRFDEAPARGLDTRPGISPRFERPREKAPSVDRLGNGLDRERGPVFGGGFAGMPGGPGLAGRAIVRDARDIPLLPTPSGYGAPIRPHPPLGVLGGDPGRMRPPFDDRLVGNRAEYGKFEPPRKFEPPVAAPPQQNVPVARTPPITVDSSGSRGYADRPAVRPQFRPGQPPPIAPIPVTVTHPVTAAPVTGMVLPPMVVPSEVKWHYRDPQGVQQGPFTLAQLKKWQATGAFPADLRVWTEHRPESSAVILTTLLATQAQSQTGRPNQPVAAPEVAQMYAVRTQAEPQKSAAAEAAQDRAKMVNPNPYQQVQVRNDQQQSFGGSNRPGEQQALYGGSNRPGESVASAQGYGSQGDGRDFGVVARDYAPRASEVNRAQFSQNSTYGRAVGEQHVPPPIAARVQDGGDRWKGNPIARDEMNRGQFDAGPRRAPDNGPGANVGQQYRGQASVGSMPPRSVHDRLERPSQGPPGGMQRPKKSLPCKFFANGYCVKGDSCDFVHQK